MSRLLCAELPFCDKEVYPTLSMPARCVLIAMYHMWLASGKRNVAFDNRFKAVMGKVMSVPDFDYYSLGRNSVTKYRKLGLVVKNQSYTFVFGADVTDGYSTGILAEIQQDSKRCKNARKRCKSARKWNNNAPNGYDNASNRIQNEDAEMDVRVVITPKHENFTD